MSSIVKCCICGHSAGDIPSSTSFLQQDLYPPEVLKLLYSNERPDDNARNKIRHALTSASQELDHVTTRITSLLAELPQLLKQRAQSERKVQDYRRILHPIRNIPADILSEIFLHFVVEDINKLEPDDLERSSIDPREMVWLLPRVSREWRTVALSSPRLWATVRLRPSDFLYRKSPFILGTQLQRSESRPLSVSIYCSDCQLPPGHPLLQVLVPTSHRWETLLLRVGVASYGALSPWCTSFPILTTLIIYPVSDDRDIDKIRQSGLTKMFQFCPVLVDISTDPLITPVMRLPFSQIRQFDASGILSTSAECVAALQMLPNLQVFHMLCNDEYVNKPNLQKVSLFHLEQLSIYNQGSGPIHLLNYLQVPALQVLAIGNLQAIDHLVPFLQHSEFTLTFLKIQSAVLIDTDYIPVLALTHSLESLSIHTPLVYTKAFIERLSRIEESMLVPSLQVLELEGMHEPETGAEMDAVLSLLESSRPDLAVGTLTLHY